MKNNVWFESCLKEKLNSYIELRESQGHQTSKIRHIFISLDRRKQSAARIILRIYFMRMTWLH